MFIHSKNDALIFFGQAKNFLSKGVFDEMDISVDLQKQIDSIYYQLPIDNTSFIVLKYNEYNCLIVPKEKQSIVFAIYTNEQWVDFGIRYEELDKSTTIH